MNAPKYTDIIMIVVLFLLVITLLGYVWLEQETFDNDVTYADIITKMNAIEILWFIFVSMTLVISGALILLTFKRKTVAMDGYRSFLLILANSTIAICIALLGMNMFPRKGIPKSSPELISRHLLYGGLVAFMGYLSCLFSYIRSLLTKWFQRNCDPAGMVGPR